MLLRDGTQFRNNGIVVVFAMVVYLLPAPPGHFIAAQECGVNWAQCRSDCSWDATCSPTLPGDIALASAPEAGCYASVLPPDLQQACPWDTFYDQGTLLGRSYGRLTGATDVPEWPFPCSRGLLGSREPNGQLSAVCDGLCPSGKYCPDLATVDPIDCDRGSYCPTGSALPLPCQEGTFSNTSNLASAAECTPAQPGFSAATGSTKQTPCRPGTVQPEEQSGACVRCAAGKFQEAEGKTACKPCEPGSYCPEGAAASLPCKAGTYSDATNLSSAAQCTPTDAGFYAPTGSAVQTACLPGTVSAEGNAGSCTLCEPGKYQPDRRATSCLPCEDEYLGVYCPYEGTSTPTPCEGGTHSNATGLSSRLECTSVEAGFYAPTGSKHPERCPASGFVCPGRTADTVNDPPGSKPILVDSGQASVAVEMDTVTFNLELDMSLDEYDETAVVANLSALYGISASLISVEAIPISDRRRLASNGSAAGSPSQRLRLVITILVPKDFVDEAGAGGGLETESSLTEAGGDGASTSPGGGGSALSKAERLANRLAGVNSVGDSGLSSALGLNVRVTKGGVVVGTTTRQIAASCAPGFWCSAANAIPCVPNTYQPEVDQIDAGACKACPDFAQSPSNSTSMRDCKCRAATATAAGYYDSDPARDKVSCEICTAGSSCPTIGTTTATLNISVGWYRTSASSTDLRRCPDASNKESGCIGGIGDEGPCKPCAASLFPRSPLALLQPLCFLSVCHSAHGLRRTGGSKDRTVGSAMSPMARATMTLALRSVCRVMTAILRRRWRFSQSASR